MIRIRIAAIVLALCLRNGAAAALPGSANVSSGCATLEFMAKMVALNTMLPANRDSVKELKQMEAILAELNQLVCQTVIMPGFARGNSFYNNGVLVSKDAYYEPWYFSNGRLFMAGAGKDTTIYYPNGRIMAHHWMHGDHAIFWPNGNLATNFFRAFDETWHYPDTNIITYEAGYAGARWFYPFARLDGGIGQEVISSEWGIEDESFTFLNFRADGSLFTTRERIRRKLIFDDIDLLDVPGVLLVITRLYQTKDGVRQFAPADINVTGAPF